jgi:RNA polymerase sigma-70 factor (ECF subfamily)
MADETSESWLQQLRDPRNSDSWRRFMDNYAPFIRTYLSRQGLPEHDTDDVVQSVLAVVVRRLPEFNRQRAGSFRSWLRTITSNCLRELWRSRKKERAAGGDAVERLCEQLEDPSSGPSVLWDKQHERFLLEYLLERVKPEFRPSTWRAFQRLVLDGQNPTEVARELGISVNAVTIARSRVLKRLREVGADVID